ncbi:MAG: hypothetical protein KBT04_03980, partial [Bacteroidales bacterium]|nr:hypothetical protein [Candidatus Colimorpha onthohippi]
PDRAFDIMVNHWYLYQVCSSRLFARAGFYQVGGATGFRDQLQDVMGILYTDPAYARRQILDHAAHQFAEGDVLHWWHESILLGSRTTFSDDYLWLVYVTYQYVQVTGDTTILDEVVSFCQADALNPGEAERGMRYTTGKHLGNLTEGCNADGGDTSFPPHSSIFDHLRLCITRALSRMGSHGLPLMGCGDWNDGMSAVGIHGRGESVWVAFFLVDLVPKFVELSRLVERTDEDFNANLMQQRETLIHNLQENAWDGAWFLRAYFDNGDPMGSRNNLECQIDLISQAWAILTDTATEDQKRSIFKECDTRLVNREHEIIQLLTPPFKHSRNNPGYICDYPIGVRENGGQYTHGAFWYIQALLKEGHYDEAYFNYSIINPIHRTSSLADVLKYKVEPYCIAADIYSNPQFPGRGGWTWYTGSASWAYKTAVENILGFHKQGSTVTLQPRIPSSWQSFTLRYRLSTTTTYTFIVGESATVLSEKTLDAVTVKVGTPIKLIDDGKEHVVLVLNDDK